MIMQLFLKILKNPPEKIEDELTRAGFPIKHTGTHILYGEKTNITYYTFDFDQSTMPMKAFKKELTKRYSSYRIKERNHDKTSYVIIRGEVK